MTQLVGFGGFAHSGKDASADLLVEERGFYKTFMSKPLLAAATILNPWIRVSWDNWVEGTWPKEQLYFETYMRLADLVDLVGYTTAKANHDVRKFLQVLGTEVGRRMFGEECWVNLLFAEVDEQMAAGRDVVITGIRYSNELAAIYKRGGLAVWVQRPGYGPVNSHASDNSLSGKDFQWLIENDGTLDDLRGDVLPLFTAVRNSIAVRKEAA